MIRISRRAGKMFVNCLDTFVKNRCLPWGCTIEIRHFQLDFLLSVLWRRRDGNMGLRFAAIIVVVEIV